MTSISLTELLPSARLFQALLAGDPAVADLLAYPLLDRAALLDAARAAAARPLDRVPLAHALRADLLRMAAPEEALTACELLADPHSVVVVTGQQPVLFGGPHLVLSKALAAIGMARWITAETGIRAVPVFWSASEDHDHGEVDHVGLARRDAAPERVRTALPADGATLAAQPLPPSLALALEQMAAWLPEGPGRERVLAALELPASGTWGDWIARLMLRLLGPLGLVVVEPRQIRPFATAVLEAEVRSPGVLHSHIQAVEQRLADAGLPAALGLQRPELFFGIEAGRRVRIPFAEGSYRLPGGELETPEALALRVSEDPQAFSWNVVTRVLAQDLALPVAAQVCGPSELGYVAATRSAHDALGIPVPALVPRCGVTIVEPQVDRALRATGRSAEDVVRLGENAWPIAVAEESDPSAALERALEELPVAPDKAVSRRLAALRKAAEQYRAALHREAESRSETEAGRRRRVLTALRPGGGLQERVCSPLGWIAQHGDPLLQSWLDAVGVPEATHTLIRTAEVQGERNG